MPKISLPLPLPHSQSSHSPTHILLGNGNVILPLGRWLSFRLSADWRRLTSFSSTAHWLFPCSRCILRVCSNFQLGSVSAEQHFTKFLIPKYMAAARAQAEHRQSSSCLMCLCMFRSSFRCITCCLPLSLSPLYPPALPVICWSFCQSARSWDQHRRVLITSWRQAPCWPCSLLLLQRFCMSH